MSFHPNSADYLTISGGIAKTLGALNLDKPWGAVVVAGGAALDVLDGDEARKKGLADDIGATVDTTTDRITEGIIVSSLVKQEVIPAVLPVIGYGVRMAIKATNSNGTIRGNLAAYCKDAAIGMAVVATVFDRDSLQYGFLRKGAITLGCVAIGLGVSELIT